MNILHVNQIASGHSNELFRPQLFHDVLKGHVEPVLFTIPFINVNAFSFADNAYNTILPESVQTFAVLKHSHFRFRMLSPIPFKYFIDLLHGQGLYQIVKGIQLIGIQGKG